MISVIIPVYNLEKYIKSCVNMFLNQTYQDFELIFTDDASNDGSLEILKSFNDPRIKIFTVKKMYAGGARNFGLSRAKGDWIVFFDGDDICENTFFEKMAKKAQDTNSDIVICASNEFIEKKQKFSNHRTAHLLKNIDENVTGDLHDIKDNSLLELVEPWNKIYKKDFLILNDIKFQEIKNSNDIVFTYKALLCAKKISIIKEILVSRRIRKFSISCFADKNWEDYFKAYKTADETVFNYKYFDEIKEAYINRKINTFAYFYKKVGILNKIPYLLKFISEIKNSNTVLKANKYNILNYLF